MKQINEVSPPGWGGSCSAMKKHHSGKIKNPWALSYYLKNHGAKPHYKNDPEGTKSKKEPEKKEKYKDEDKKLEFKEWLQLNEGRKRKKKSGIKLVNNIEGEPTEVEEAFDLNTARVAHSAIAKMGYGMGRPKVQGDNLIYNTGDPEDAQMIAADIPKQLANWGIKGTAVAKDTNIIVTIIG